jgi:phage FluMu protein Com
MPTKTISKCASCGYPLAAEYPGQQVSCPNCGTVNEAVSQQGVSIPTWLFAGGIGFFAGLLLGPTIVTSTKEGAQWMSRRVSERLAR